MSGSISEGQVLSEPYSYNKAKIIVREMADNIVMQLVAKNLVTELITLDIGYDRENCERTGVAAYTGDVKKDHYGRLVPKPAHGSMRLGSPTNLGSEIITAAVAKPAHPRTGRAAFPHPAPCKAHCSQLSP